MQILRKSIQTQENFLFFKDFSTPPIGFGRNDEKKLVEMMIFFVSLQIVHQTFLS